MEETDSAKIIRLYIYKQDTVKQEEKYEGRNNHLFDTALTFKLN
jgi:hypothetical protein